MAINRLYSKQMKVDDMEDKNKKENKDLDRRLNKAKSIEEISELISHQMIYLAKAVKKDYENNPSDISGSVVNIHQNSPFLDSDEKGEPLYTRKQWRKMLKGSVEDAMAHIKKKKNNKKA